MTWLNFTDIPDIPVSTLDSVPDMAQSSKRPSAPSESSPPTMVNSCISPWLMSLAYPLGNRVVLPFYFDHIQVQGQENLPQDQPMILAPTHRSRWDALLVPYAAGKLVTGKHLRFMVSSDEVVGLQGWFIRRLGGFPIDTTGKPAIATLRYGIEVLCRKEPLVIFPEGNIYQGQPVQPLKPGLARLALQAEAVQAGLGLKIVPISLHYDPPGVPWRTSVQISIGQPLSVDDYHSGSSKQRAKTLTHDLELALGALHDRHYADSILVSCGS